MTKRRVACFLVLMSLAGCGPSISTRAIGFDVSPSANDSSPVPVELVVAYDPDVVPLLLELTARQWFEGRDQLLLDHPRGLQSHLWELVPGQELPMTRLPVERDDAYAAFVYADFLTPGAHRVRVDPYERVLLELTSEDIVLAEPEE